MSGGLEVAQVMPKVTLVHHVGPTRVWASSGRQVLSSEDGNLFEPFCRFPQSLPRDLLLRPRLLARMSRADKCNVYETRDGNLLGIRDGRVFDLTAGQPREIVTIQGDCVLACGICEDSEGAIYFGEYFRNKDRGPVRVFRMSSDLNSAEVVHEFPAGEIRHVHGVFCDPYEPDSLWLTSGDLRGECYLYQTRDRYKTLRRIGEGTQAWRAVQLHFTPESVCWITDSHLETNRASRMDRESEQLEQGQEFDGSGWYGAKTIEGKYVAFTTVEVGPAIRSDRCEVFLSEDAFHWHSVGHFSKDAWRPMKLFKFGVINCPLGPQRSDDFFVSGEGLRGLDGKSARLRLVTTESASGRWPAPKQ